MSDCEKLNPFQSLELLKLLGTKALFFATANSKLKPTELTLFWLDNLLEGAPTIIEIMAVMHRCTKRSGVCAMKAPWLRTH